MNRTLLIVLGGVAAAVLLFVFVVNPLLAGDEVDEADEATAISDPGGATDEDVAVDDDPDLDPDLEPDPDAESAPDDGEEDEEDEEPEPLPETFEVFTARDPFQQLVTDEGADGTTPTEVPDSEDASNDDDDSNDDGTGSGTGTGTVIGDDDDDDDGNGNAGGTSNSDDDDDAPSDATVGGTTVRLEEVYTGSDGEERVQVTVNTSGYDVAEGQDFASRFRVIDIDDPCATLLFGDQRFTLCEGETIRK